MWETIHYYGAKMCTCTGAAELIYSTKMHNNTAERVNVTKENEPKK